MIVYVESNFVLEMALRQRYASATEAVLQLAETDKIMLICPGFALSEPFATVARRARDQERLSKSLIGMFDQLPALLEEAVKREREQLWTIVDRLVNVATSIEINADCLKRAAECQKKFDLSPQDSIIYAAVILDMQDRSREEPKCFLNSNYKDFEIPDILDELNSYYCYYERSFGRGLNYIQNCLKSQA